MPKFELNEDYLNAPAGPKLEIVPEDGDLRIQNGGLEKYNLSGFWEHIGNLDDVIQKSFEHTTNIALLVNWRDEILKAEENRIRKETESAVLEEQFDDLKMAGDCLRLMRKKAQEIQDKLREMESAYDEMVVLTREKKLTFDTLAADHTNEEPGYSI